MQVHGGASFGWPLFFPYQLCILLAVNFSRQELAARAQLTVELILTALAERRMIPVFIEEYAKAQRRNELLESATRYRELVLMLNREALLALSVRVCGDVPRKLFGAAADSPKNKGSKSLDYFREEYFFHLAKVMQWTPEELEEFYNDFELCQMIAIRQSAQSAAKRPAAKAKARTPAAAQSTITNFFADRGSLLLDPSFMERARAAAMRFAPELDALATKSLAAAFKAKP